MRAPHIAIFSAAYASAVNPTLSVVASLVRRGFRVSYVTSERFRSAAAALGAEFVPCPSFPTSDEQPGRYHNHERVLVDLAERALPQVRAFYKANRPALVIYDLLSLAGRIVAHELGVAAIQTSSALALDKELIESQLPARELREEILDDARDTDAFLARHGIVGNFPFHREGLNIYFYPKLFQLAGSPADPRCFFAARCTAEQPYARQWTAEQAGDRPIVLVSGSTLYVQGPDYFKMCIEALSGLSWHVVLAIGNNNSRESLGPLPPHFEIFQHMPQIQVLPRADLLICLGGTSTSVEAMYHGVPMLMITHGFQEPELYAENMAKLGVGRHLGKESTNVVRIRQAALEILNDKAMHNNVRRMQHLVQREPGAEETVNRITEYLELSRCDSVGAGRALGC